MKQGITKTQPTGGDRPPEASTLARFPHVGAVVAASATGETHEWDAYRQGVFTHAAPPVPRPDSLGVTW